MSQYSYDLSLSLAGVQHLPKKKRYKITLEVNKEIGARIMEYAAMLGGLRRWDEDRLLDGGLRLADRGSEVPE
jgi:hypothetical protein